MFVGNGVGIVGVVCTAWCGREEWLADPGFFLLPNLLCVVCVRLFFVGRILQIFGLVHANAGVILYSCRQTANQRGFLVYNCSHVVMSWSNWSRRGILVVSSSWPYFSFFIGSRARLAACDRRLEMKVLGWRAHGFWIACNTFIAAWRVRRRLMSFIHDFLEQTFSSKPGGGGLVQICSCFLYGCPCMIQRFIVLHTSTACDRGMVSAWWDWTGVWLGSGQLCSYAVIRRKHFRLVLYWLTHDDRSAKRRWPLSGLGKSREQAYHAQTRNIEWHGWRGRGLGGRNSAVKLVYFLAWLTASKLTTVDVG